MYEISYIPVATVVFLSGVWNNLTADIKSVCIVKYFCVDCVTSCIIHTAPATYDDDVMRLYVYVRIYEYVYTHMNL
jgi:hypothetical protein